MRILINGCVACVLILFLFGNLNHTGAASVADDIIIGIIDTGFNSNHPDLENMKVQTGPPKIIDRLFEFFEVPQEINYFGKRSLSHGNAVASIISETSGRDKGEGLYAYSAREFEDFRDALKTAVADGAKIINISLDEGNQSAEEKKRMQQEMYTLIKEEMQDVLIIVGAGNNGELADNKVLAGLASKLDNVITVGGVNSKGERWEHSDYGDAVTIAAPAENILVAQSGIGFTPDYDRQSGTSYAAPYVTGVVAKIWSANPELSPKEIKTILTQTADVINGDQDKLIGAGFINADKSITLAKEFAEQKIAEKETLSPPEETSLKPQQEATAPKPQQSVSKSAASTEIKPTEPKPYTGPEPGTREYLEAFNAQHGTGGPAISLEEFMGTTGSGSSGGSGGGSDGGGHVWAKPVLYLYPEKTISITVTIDTLGEIFDSIPDYGNGWVVTVEPSGLIDGVYDYLFYEIDIDYDFSKEVGWVFTREQFAFEMTKVLYDLGLRGAEIDEFIEFWDDTLRKDTNYYAVYLMLPEEVEEAAKLNFSTNPDSMLRVHFIFEPVTNRIPINRPNFETFIRKGFTIVEWGGLMIE
jgi:hypothetical protein